MIVDNIRSLYNVGALFRLADGVGVKEIYLCGLTGYPKIADDPRPEWVANRADKEIHKTGLAGVEAITWRYFKTTDEAVRVVKAAGHQVVALELTESSVDYRSAKYTFPVAVIVGHETDGVADEALQMADLTVHLPMRGKGKSLNVTTAAASFLYFLAEQIEN